MMLGTKRWEPSVPPLPTHLTIRGYLIRLRHDDQPPGGPLRDELMGQMHRWGSSITIWINLYIEPEGHEYLGTLAHEAFHAAMVINEDGDEEDIATLTGDIVRGILGLRPQDYTDEDM